MGQFAIEHADMVLIDIQGAEANLLHAVSAEFLRERVRFLCISTHDLSISGSATTHQDVLNQVIDLGGHVLVEHSVSESYSGDGLILCSFDERDRDVFVEISYARSRDSLFGEWEPRLETIRLALAALRPVE